MDATAPLAIEIFRAGRHTDMHGRQFEISAADLADIASRYDPAAHEAPLVIGHPQLNAPAYGWVQGLRAQGDTLLADAHQVDAAFAEAVKAGRWKKRSAAFLLPHAPDNPTPGQYYLQHVGFLGAQVPAVKGLRDVQFAAAAEHVAEFAADRRWGLRDVAALFRSLRDWLVERDGIQAAEAVIPGWQLDSLVEAGRPDALTDPAQSRAAFAAPATQETPVSEATPTDAPAAALAARDQALSQKAADLLAREQAIEAREAQARRTEAAEFASSLVQAGQLLPAQADTVTELLLVLPDQPLTFAAGQGGGTVTAQPADALRQLLSAMPKQVDYTEKSPAAAADAPAAFAGPAGEPVDPAALEVHARAMAHMRQHPDTPYLAAVKAVGG